MRRYICIALVLLTAAVATACNRAQTDAEVTAYVFPTEVTDEETTETEQKIKIVEETIAAPKRRSATEPKETKATAAEETKNEPTTETATATVTAPNVPTQGRTKPNTRVNVTRPPKGSFTKADLDFIYDGGYVYLGDDVDDVMAILGEDFDAEELSSKKLLYTNDEFEFVTVTEGEKETLKTLSIVAPGVSTPKGAEVGMYATKVSSIYGDPSEARKNAFIYSANGKSLIIEFYDNIVTKISYRIDS